MALNSCLYTCDLMHYRREPREHRLNARLFMFYIDIDELAELPRRFWLLGHNQPRVYNFCETDHLCLEGTDLRKTITTLLRGRGIHTAIGKIMLLTNLRVFGYNFNPVSFYFCFDTAGRPAAAVCEINNTFREIKPFVLGAETLSGGRFQSRQQKYFYISPFMDLDLPLDFNLGIPGERLDVRIDDVKDGKKFFYASLTGERRPLTHAQLAWFGLSIPLVTLKIIGMIHWHAVLLYLKGIPYFEKTGHPQLQKGVFRVWYKNQRLATASADTAAGDVLPKNHS